ncbi:MAG TPA: hypothetical protein VGC54_12500 [Planctomycetota bacterium]
MLRSASAFLILLLAACHGGNASTASGSASAAASFSPLDLAGDWTGILAPTNPLKETLNFCVRVDPAGLPLMGVTALGHEWIPGQDLGTAAVSPKGLVFLQLLQPAGEQVVLELDGSFDRARTRVTGSYRLFEHGTIRSSGRFGLWLSSGPGHFSVATHLAGKWEGSGYNRHDRWRGIRAEIDADGSVLSGDIGAHQWEAGGTNHGIFAFDDSALGILRNVTIQATNGESTTFRVILVDDAGGLMGGPGVDTTLGAGVGRLVRSPL